MRHKYRQLEVDHNSVGNWRLSVDTHIAQDAKGGEKDMTATNGGTEKACDSVCVSLTRKWPEYAYRFCAH